MARRFQFSLRALLALLLAVALVAAIERHSRQRRINDARERVDYWQHRVVLASELHERGDLDSMEVDQAMVRLLIEEATLADLVGSR